MLPVPFDKEVDRDIRDRVVMFWNTSGEFGPSNPILRRALTLDELTKLNTRGLHISQALAPLEDTCRDRSLQIEMAGMLGGFPSMQRHDKAAAAAIAYGYLHVVKECPPWAIVAACEQVRTSRAGLNPSYPPSEPEFREVVDGMIKPFSDRLYRINELLAAPIEPPAPEPPSKERVEEILGRAVPKARVDTRPPGAFTAAEHAAAERDLKKRKRKALKELKASE